MHETSSSPPRLRFRFSLLTILLVTALVACAFTIWRQSQEIQPLKSQLALLRKEVGALDVRDRSKVHAIQMPTDHRLAKKWRIWIPPGYAAMICHAYQGNLGSGLPAAQGVSVVEPGEHIVRWSYEANLQDDKWTQKVHVDSSGFSGGPFKRPAWLESGYASVGAGKETFVEGPSGLEIIDQGDGVKRVLIQRLRYNPRGIGALPEVMNDPLLGFVLWVELRPEEGSK